jgi:intracellular sulfur oxidation DsrE/DsrF family protein
MIGLVAKKHSLADDAPRKIAVAALVPGVILRPSGVLAVLHAQDVGCNYIRAS